MSEILTTLPYPPELLRPLSLPIDSLTVLSPPDGRYAPDTAVFRPFLSEFALMRGSLMVDIKLLQAMAQEGVVIVDGQVRRFTPKEVRALDRTWQKFSLKDARRIKAIERQRLHVVKSQEYWLKEQFTGTSLMDVVEWVRFGITSEDDTNCALNVNLGIVKDGYLVPALWRFTNLLEGKVDQWPTVSPMPGRTHQKRALPTTVPKEIELFAPRLAEETETLARTPFRGKLMGAVGNLNELRFARPDINWIAFSKRFVESLGLEPTLFVTQSQPHDRWAEIFHNLLRINTIVISLDDNVRSYIGHDYFRLPPREKQIGSSVMPHKGRNPEFFDRSAGNGYPANFLLEGFARVLPNRLFQRQFDDSSMSRWIGLAFGASYLHWKFAGDDLRDLILQREDTRNDLRWEMVTAGLQTRLRAIGFPEPYEMFDQLAKAGPVTRERIVALVESLGIPPEEKDYLLRLTPETFLGYAPELTQMMMDKVAEIRGW